jgi:hypothetical protein
MTNSLLAYAPNRMPDVLATNKNSSDVFNQKLVFPLIMLVEHVLGKLSPLRHKSFRGSSPDMQGVMILTTTYMKAQSKPIQIERMTRMINQIRVQMIRSIEQDPMISS